MKLFTISNVKLVATLLVKIVVTLFVILMIVAFINIIENFDAYVIICVYLYILFMAAVMLKKIL